VLVDGDDMNEPIADAVRSILDGHVVLTRALAHASHYPAIDVLQSVSRLVDEVVAPDVRAAGQMVRQLLAAYCEKEDLIAIGAYQRGSDAIADAAIDLRPRIERFLRQAVGERSSAAEADAALLDLAAAIAEHAAGEPAELLDAEPVGAAAQPPPPVPPNSAAGLASPLASPAIPPLGLRG
jgi:flagellum-specific ATP synthase